MKLSDMTEPERHALGSLVRVTVGVEGEYLPDEYAALDQAAEELGKEDFWELVERSGREQHTEEIVKAQARAVERQEARETIYGVLFNLAAAGSIVREEGKLLDWLAGAWELEAATEVAKEDG